MSNPLASLIMARAPAFNVDPRAALAVASREGLGGGIGDNGTSFGPFQLHQGGAYPSYAPQDPSGAQAWASSPAGINYALSRIGSVAGGLRGASAITNIVKRFERPANPEAEINGAIANYGASAGAGGNTFAPTTPAPPHGGDGFLSLIQGLLGGKSPAMPNPTTAQLGAPGPLTGPPPQVNNTTALLTALLSAGKTPSPTLTQRPEPAVGANPATAGPSRLTSVPTNIAARPGIEVNSQIAPDVAQVANLFGVKVESGFRSAEHNAAVGGAENSDHLKGNAVDFVGSPQAMQHLYQWAQGKYPYVEPWDQSGGNHVHISFIR